MSVDLEINLEADGVESGITGIAGALETLDGAANDLDLDVDLDNIDVGEITGDIGNTLSQLRELDSLLEGIQEKGSNIGDFDDITHKVKHQHEDAGSTNKGDSTGGDPPDDDGDGISRSQTKQRLEDQFGFDRGSFRLFDELDADKLKDIEGQMAASVDGHQPIFGPAEPVEGPVPADSGLSRGEINQKKWRGHDGNLGAAMLPDSVGGIFSGDGIAVQTDEGLFPLKDAIRRKQSKGSDSGVAPNIPTLDPGVKQTLRDFRERQADLKEKTAGPSGIFDIEGGKLHSEEVGSDADWAGQRWRNTASVPIPDDALRDTGTSAYMERIDGDGSLFSRVDKIRNKSDGIDALGNEMGNIDKVLRKFKPSLGKYMQLLAAIIPIAVALAPALLGVAGAMGAVAASGAAFIGLGLLGHAESFEGAMADAQERVKGLKRDLFDTFQPAMQSFAPIQGRAFDAIPQALDPVAEKMEELTVFEGSFFQMGSMLANSLEMALGIILANQDAVRNLATSFTRLLTTGLLEFFDFLFKAAEKNKNLLVDIGTDFAKLISAAYNLTVAITNIISAFSPFITIILALSELLNNEIIRTFASMAGWMYILGKSALLIYGLYGAFMSLAGGIAKAALMMFGYEMSTWGAVAATLALAGAVALVTAGISAAAGALASGATINDGTSRFDTGGGPGGGGQTVYNDNRSYRVEGGGNMDYATQKGVQREIEKGSESSSAREYPDISLDSTESDSDSTK